jgi:hypothetical protein
MHNQEGEAIGQDWKDRRVQQAISGQVGRGLFRKLTREEGEKYCAMGL